MKLELNNHLETYLTLKALTELRDKEDSWGSNSVEDIDSLISQFRGYPAYRVLVSEGELSFEN